MADMQNHMGQMTKSMAAMTADQPAPKSGPSGDHDQHHKDAPQGAPIPQVK